MYSEHMANTLILAYIGSSLSVVLLLRVYSSSVLYLFNREMIVVEILQSFREFRLAVCNASYIFSFCIFIYREKDPYQK